MTPLRKRRHADTGHVPARSTYEPLPDSARLHLPVRVRVGADKTITQEVIDKAMREFRAKPKR